MAEADKFPKAILNQLARQISGLMTAGGTPFARMNDLPLHPWEVGTAVEALGNLWAVTPDGASGIIKGNLRRLASVL